MRVFSRFVDLFGLRAEFPVLRELVYLNAGTDGPLPSRAVQAVAEELEREAREGRASAHFERRTELNDRLRDAYARALGAEPADVALTTCTTEGIAQVIGGLELSPGEEILTSDEEHPGLLGALAAARELHGVEIREVAFGDLASAAGARTRLIACSHVGWMSGLLAPRELAELDVPVLLDGAQGVGAVPVDVQRTRLRRLCRRRAEVAVRTGRNRDALRRAATARAPRRHAPRLLQPRGSERRPAGKAARRRTPLRHDVAQRRGASPVRSPRSSCSSRSAGAPFTSAPRTLAARLAEQLQERGRAVAPRDATTLVSFESADAEAERDALAARGCVVRNIPGRTWLRASVGAWNDENDLARLLESLSA